MTREEAIRRVKAWNLDSDDMEVLKVIIPELRESEDENLKNKSGYYKDGKFWKASTLWNATKNKVPQRVSNRYILQECTWNIGTLQRFANEVKNVQEVSLDYPIILDMNGNILDGAHRVVKAYLEGKDIDIVYIGDNEWPEPDYDEEKAVRESEDERIRKFLIRHISEWIGCIEHDLKNSSKDIESEKELAMFKAGLAYLEKQKEQKEESLRDFIDNFPYSVEQEEQNEITIEQVYKEFINPEKLKDAKINKYIRAQLLWELMHNGIITKVDYQYLTDTNRKPWTEEEYRKAYQKDFEASEQLKQKEQKPVPFSCGHENGKPTEWAELQSEFKNINEAFEDGKKEVVAHPEKYGLSKPTEWSEEDENALKYIHELLVFGYTEKFMDAQTAHDMRKWVNEHLRPVTFQNGNSHWKPSEEQPSPPDNLKLNMTRTKLELSEIETLTHLVRAKAVEPGNFQGLYKNILSKLNKMFDEEYAERERKEEK